MRWLADSAKTVQVAVTASAGCIQNPIQWLEGSGGKSYGTLHCSRAARGMASSEVYCVHVHPYGTHCIVFPLHHDQRMPLVQPRVNRESIAFFGILRRLTSRGIYPRLLKLQRKRFLNVMHFQTTRGSCRSTRSREKRIYIPCRPQDVDISGHGMEMWTSDNLSVTVCTD